MAKKKKENMDFISKEQMRKLDRKVRRDLDLERGTFIRTGAHETSKKDEFERTSKKLSKSEIDELLEEELEELDADSYGYFYDHNVI